MIALLGPKKKIAAFQSLGITIFPCDLHTAKESAEKLTAKYQVIFYTPEIYPALKETIARFQKNPLPCFVLLPSLEEKVSEERIAELVKKATGTDILNK